MSSTSREAGLERLKIYISEPVEQHKLHVSLNTEGLLK
jgi:hypothetical protein